MEKKIYNPSLPRGKLRPNRVGRNRVDDCSDHNITWFIRNMLPWKLFPPDTMTSYWYAGGQAIWVATLLIAHIHTFFFFFIHTYIHSTMSPCNAPSLMPIRYANRHTVLMSNRVLPDVAMPSKLGSTHGTTSTFPIIAIIDFPILTKDFQLIMRWSQCIRLTYTHISNSKSMA